MSTTFSPFPTSSLYLYKRSTHKKKPTKTYTSLFVVYCPYNRDSYAVHFTGSLPLLCQKIKERKREREREKTSQFKKVKCLHGQSNHACTNGYSIYWPIRSLTRVLEFSIKTISWLWRWLPHRLSKRQSQKGVLFRAPLTQMIFFNQGM